MQRHGFKERMVTRLTEDWVLKMKHYTVLIQRWLTFQRVDLSKYFTISNRESTFRERVNEPKGQIYLSL